MISGRIWKTVAKTMFSNINSLAAIFQMTDGR